MHAWIRPQEKSTWRSLSSGFRGRHRPRPAASGAWVLVSLFMFLPGSVAAAGAGSAAMAATTWTPWAPGMLASTIAAAGFLGQLLLMAGGVTLGLFILISWWLFRQDRKRKRSKPE